MDPRRLLARISRGDVSNVRFGDACRLIEAVGFELRRTSGSHHVFVHPSVREILSLQDVDGEAKPYQMRQLLRLIVRYGLTVERDV